MGNQMRHSPSTLDTYVTCMTFLAFLQKDPTSVNYLEVHQQDLQRSAML